MTIEDTIALVQESLRENGASNDLIENTIRDLMKAAQDEKAQRASPKRSKKQIAILVSDPEGVLEGLSLVGWAVEMEESAPPQAAYTRVLEAANRFNESKKGRKHPIKTLGEAAEGLKGKWLKRDNPEEKLAIKNRTPAALQAVLNELPKSTS